MYERGFGRSGKSPYHQNGILARRSCGDEKQVGCCLWKTFSNFSSGEKGFRECTHTHTNTGTAPASVWRKPSSCTLGPLMCCCMVKSSSRLLACCEGRCALANHQPPLVTLTKKEIVKKKKHLRIQYFHISMLHAPASKRGAS